MKTGDLQQRLTQLLNEHEETMREASLSAGLNPGALSSYISKGTTPSIDACIRLAFHFSVNPNVLLRLAGHPILPYFPDSSTSEIEADMLHTLKGLPRDDQLEILVIAQHRAKMRRQYAKTQTHEETRDRDSTSTSAR